MKLSAEEIEEVVREVLFRIQPTKSAKTETRQATNVAGIEIGDRVVATAQISKIAEHTTVRIGGSAIVTPNEAGACCRSINGNFCCGVIQAIEATLAWTESDHRNGSYGDGAGVRGEDSGPRCFTHGRC